MLPFSFSFQPDPALVQILEQLRPEYDLPYTGPPVAPVDIAIEVQAGSFAQLSQPDGHRLPIGFVAPLDLYPGDLCAVRVTDGTLLSVYRGGGEIYRAEPDPKEVL